MKQRQLFYFLISFLIVAGGQPDWNVLACILTSAIGYALFWKGLVLTTGRKKRFFQAALWLAAVQSVHLSWFAADRYVGVYIYLFLICLSLALGAQFGLISLFLNTGSPTVLQMLGISGGWALLEWGRLFFQSGFSWDPVGLALSGTLYGMQLASTFGVFGMSFWVFFTNLMALRLLNDFSPRRLALWSAIAITPYFFGWAHVAFHSKQMEQHDEKLSALLVQTSLYPEHKLPLDGSDPLSPDLQWERILSLLFPYVETNPDLIVLSEAVVPYGANYPIYPLETVQHAFEAFFQDRESLPAGEAQYVGNAYWARALANFFSSDVVIGLEDFDFAPNGKVERAYNAAFLARPGLSEMQRYEKRVLVPMGEYIPFAWCRPFLAKYGIVDSFTPGQEAKVFDSNRTPIGLSICYEETYGHLMRESRVKGAGLLINLTNDVWYPRSRLPLVHFYHGRLRAVEGGVPCLRACNTGVTCGVDSLGRVVGMLDYESASGLSPADALFLSMPLYHYPTFYTRFGDFPVVLLSALCFMSLCVGIVFRRKLFYINDLDVSPLRKN